MMEEKEISSLRPKKLSEYVGQNDTKEIIDVYLKAAIKRGEAPDHLLFYGPSGLGKTTLAEIISNELDTNFKAITAGSIEKTGDLISILTSLNAGDILFIDEIHRLPKIVEEVLYSAMEDYVVDVVIDKDGEKRTLRLDLVPFTLIGATTMFGNISSPLRSRFGAIFKLNYYTCSEILEILKRTALIYDVKYDEMALYEIAKRSRFTPRIANQLFLRIRDFADVLNSGCINMDIVIKGFKLLKIDFYCVYEYYIIYFKALLNNFSGGPVGIETLSTFIHEDQMTVFDVYEPYLISEGYIKCSPRGRVALDKAYKKLGLSKRSKKDLFSNE